MEEHTVICPGCGVKIASENKTSDKDFNALYVCRHLCFELSYFTLSLKDPYFIHQLVVDAYASQHSGKYVKTISTVFGIIGLYLVHKRKYTGKQVQLTHMTLARKAKIWPRFSIPQHKPWLTVKDVVQSPDFKKQEKIHTWSKSVWDVWKPEEQNIISLLEQYNL